MRYDVLTCPACGDPLEDDDGEIPESIQDGRLRVAVDCPTCDMPLRVDFDDLDPRTGDVAVSIETREE
ncbi:CpXC domain-containing protein [Halomicroarcula sp. F13]|uniref:CpXC domain-containing protein n=1 Tax=Haloarcula rubra TaxID=2487747 RepID=A0AAW4PVV6_9EURY|nr:CpXC domain-containing protein [Halomicroarcula rubra]MBX0325307.1 CpXC domain-containing protein [Halomicroarcula rubra]